MQKISCLNPISKLGLELLEQDKYQVVEENDVDALLVRSFKMHDYEMPSTLKAIGRAGAGVNNIPLEKCAEKGIVVFNTPGANANGVKELVLASLLMSSRDLLGGVNWVKSIAEESDIPQKVEKNKKQFAGPEIMGKKIGVIGLGAIGAMVANAASALGMEVLGYDPFISVEGAWGLSTEVKRAVSLDEIYTQADYISIHVPAIDATKGMLNCEAFDKMKEGVRIINLSRGELVNDDDMEIAIKNGKVAQYVTDFPNEKVAAMDNVITIPHLGASTPESEDNCAIMAVLQIKDYLENGNITNSVNYPQCSLGICQAPARLAINHQNVTNMVGQITTLLANNNINIIDMVNKSKDKWAYTLIDLESDITDDTVKKLESIEGIVKVRVIK
ncbi:D-3-phosphoglycerate dehydrogenase [Natranaerovirga hydrolytica]|uniref:D-3-phosphoglycerate dehydrogenase n=1 Tax=Natranaerovirga hydrolytica TaxID=680378 RepID=A0A4R1N0J5_9FIRM|nr:phosphoglycerate dehydrogenase [Natranaerovirga hydrolytica]TCK98430.1 D-3-phosphoglycerate dehydrogenase [Natranaerovirga hydrolytica]